MTTKKKRRTPPRAKSPKSLIATFIGIVIALMVLVSDQVSAIRLPQGQGPVELYSNQAGDDLRTTIVKAIETAQDTIVMAVYSLNDNKIIKALKAKADAGVEVYVVVDIKASPQAHKALGPNVTTIRRSSAGLMHLKILLVDSKQVWVGSANMGYESLRIHGNLMIAMENEPLAKCLDKFLRDMPDAGPITQACAAPLRFAQEGQDGDLWMLPDSKQALKTLLGLLNNAQESIEVAMFTWTHPAITDAIIAAKMRGVKVTVVIDSNQGAGSGSEAVEKLRSSGVTTYLSRGEGLLHYKMAIIDEATLVIGSANWTRSAFTRNDDCFVVLWPLTTNQQDYLRRLWGVIVHESDRGTRYSCLDEKECVNF